METLYSLWSENKRVEIATIGLKLIDASETHLLLDANGNKVQVLIPSSIQAYDEGLEKLEDEVFIAMSLENSDELLDRYLHSLNEKLERIKVTPKALHDVLDLLLTMLIKFDKQRCQSERKQSHLTGGGGKNLLHSKEPVQQVSLHLTEDAVCWPKIRCQSGRLASSTELWCTNLSPSLPIILNFPSTVL
jgi:hypothetical protein